MTLAIVIGFFVMGVLVAVERRARLGAEGERSRVEAEIEIERNYSRRVLDQAADEREAAAKERKELYQRIQAPEIAVHEAQLERRRDRPYVRREPVGADNDAAFAARRRAAAKSDEESTD